MSKPFVIILINVSLVLISNMQLSHSWQRALEAASKPRLSPDSLPQGFQQWTGWIPLCSWTADRMGGKVGQEAKKGQLVCYSETFTPTLSCFQGQKTLMPKDCLSFENELKITANESDKTFGLLIFRRFDISHPIRDRNATSVRKPKRRAIWTRLQSILRVIVHSGRLAQKAKDSQGLLSQLHYQVRSYLISLLGQFARNQEHDSYVLWISNKQGAAISYSVQESSVIKADKSFAFLPCPSNGTV